MKIKTMKSLTTSPIKLAAIILALGASSQVFALDAAILESTILSSPAASSTPLPLSVSPTSTAKTPATPEDELKKLSCEGKKSRAPYEYAKCLGENLDAIKENSEDEALAEDIRTKYDRLYTKAIKSIEKGLTATFRNGKIRDADDLEKAQEKFEDLASLVEYHDNDDLQRDIRDLRKGLTQAAQASLSLADKQNYIENRLVPRIEQLDYQREVAESMYDIRGATAATYAIEQLKAQAQFLSRQIDHYPTTVTDRLSSRFSEQGLDFSQFDRYYQDALMNVRQSLAAITGMDAASGVDTGNGFTRGRQARDSGMNLGNYGSRVLGQTTQDLGMDLNGARTTGGNNAIDMLSQSLNAGRTPGNRSRN